MDWTGLDEDEDAHVWEDNWDDDNVEDDFSNQLRSGKEPWDHLSSLSASQPPVMALILLFQGMSSVNPTEVIKGFASKNRARAGSSPSTNQGTSIVVKGAKPTLQNLISRNETSQQQSRLTGLRRSVGARSITLALKSRHLDDTNQLAGSSAGTGKPWRDWERPPRAAQWQLNMEKEDNEIFQNN
ncbi:26S proteasome complex subunit DSS1 [Aix galericulata]|nr:26S proteasome complex subunit DSS1 [Aix galericulata]